MQSSLDRLSDLILSKGIVTPTVHYSLVAHAEPHISLVYYKTPPYHDFTCKVWRTFDEAFAEVSCWPDPEIAVLNRHNNRLAALIDLARDDGVDDQYITPLVATRQALSSNLLAAQ
jgi:hypothetical protein